MAVGYEVGFDHLSMHLPHWAGIHCFTNSVIDNKVLCSAVLPLLSIDYGSVQGPHEKYANSFVKI